jgi:hypothetical protein
MFKSILILTPLLWIAACSPTMSILNHSPSLAAQEAQRFAQAALIERDFQKAYGWFGEGGKAAASFDQFTEALRSSHPMAFPQSVTAIEYEPIPGQRGMNIYLFGENGNEKFYYRFAMEGVKETGYKVSGLWRHDGPYPPSSSRRRLDESL